MHRTQLFAVFTLGKMPLQMLFSTVVKITEKVSFNLASEASYGYKKSSLKMPKLKKSNATF